MLRYQHQINTENQILAVINNNITTKQKTKTPTQVSFLTSFFFFLFFLLYITLKLQCIDIEIVPIEMPLDPKMCGKNMSACQ